MGDDLRDRIAAALSVLSIDATRLTDAVFPVVQAAITEAKREAWDEGHAQGRLHGRLASNPYAAGEHDAPAGEPSPAADDGCAICGDIDDHYGQPHSEAMGDGRTRTGFVPCVHSMVRPTCASCLHGHWLRTTAAAAEPAPAASCRVWHDLYGACELPYRHDGPHSRIPGGATEPNTWTDESAAEPDVCEIHKETIRDLIEDRARLQVELQVARGEGGFVADPPSPADPLTEAKVAESIAAARANQAFMNRLAERIEQDRGLLDRIAAGNTPTRDGGDGNFPGRVEILRENASTALPAQQPAGPTAEEAFWCDVEAEVTEALRQCGDHGLTDPAAVAGVITPIIGDTARAWADLQRSEQPAGPDVEFHPTPAAQGEEKPAGNSGPDVDTAAIRALYADVPDIANTRRIHALCDALDARDAELAQLKAELAHLRGEAQ